MRALKYSLIALVWAGAFVLARMSLPREVLASVSSSLVATMTPTAFLPVDPTRSVPTPVAGTPILVRVSHYWPPLGPPNCWEPAWFGNGDCRSLIWGGTRPWQDFVEIGIACPKEWDLGTTLVIDGRKWICADTGGAIVYGEDGIPWIDMLIAEAIYPHGEVVEAILLDGAE